MGLVKIEVEYYNKEEESLIETNYPEEYKIINESIKNGVRVPFEDFKVYSQFHHQNSELSEFRNFGNIRNQVSDLWGSLNVYTKYSENDEKFNSKYSHNNEQTGISESIGCAGILSFLSFTFGLTDADWHRINIQGHKDFDFNSAVISDFSKMIVAEAKGSIVADSSGNKDQKIVLHKSKIKEKKKNESLKKKYSNGVDLLIGGITAIDPKNHVKLWLVDPPIESNLNSSQRRKIKLIKRLSYYNSIFKFISKRSYFSITLTNRISALSMVEDVLQLDELTLTNSSGKQLFITDQAIGNYSNIEKSIIGKFHPISDELAVFIGLPLELFEIISGQKQGEILNYKTSTNTSSRVISCRISLSQDRNRRFIGNSEIQKFLEKKDGYLSFQTKPVDVFQSSSGLNFAFIYSYQIL